MAKRKVKAKDLVDQIERIAKERMAKESFVTLSEYRKLRSPKDPKVILLIEDDETMRKSMKRIFESDGHSVVAVSDGTELRQFLEGIILDLVVLDVGLPWINGFELAELMKSHQELKDIPLIFVSGHSQSDEVKRGFALGADDYIKKPFSIDEIRSAVNTLLKLHSPSDG